MDPARRQDRHQDRDPARRPEIKSEHIVPYVEHFPPDTAAAFIWLKNRQPHRWRDKKEVHETGDHTSQQPVVFELSPGCASPPR